MLIVVHLPSFQTVEDLLDYCESSGLTDVRVWKGPDNLFRGTARKVTP
jgi:hypothetical protein